MGSASFACNTAQGALVCVTLSSYRCGGSTPNRRGNSAKSIAEARSVGSLRTDGGERKTAAARLNRLGRPRLMTAMGPGRVKTPALRLLVENVSQFRQSEK